MAKFAAMLGTTAAAGTAAAATGTSFAAAGTAATAAAWAAPAAASLTLTDALLLGGFGLQAAGSLAGGAAARQAGAFNAAMAEHEGQLARANAAFEEQRHRKRTGYLLSAQRAAFASSGVRMEGSPLLVMEESASEAELDAQLIRYGGEVQADKLYARAALDRLQGRAAQVGSFFDAGGALLKGGARYTSRRPIGERTLLGDF